MLSSVLLHFADTQHGQPVIDLVVRLARRSAAKVRGLTLVDTRRLAELTASSEAACYAASEFDRLHRVEVEQDTVRQQLSQACLSAGVDFDLRRVRGNPLEVLPPESQFHDLVVTSFPSPGDSESVPGTLSAADLLDLLFQGVEPLLVVRSAERPLRRVLLVGDGTRPSARAIRHFVQQNLLPGAELRLLAVGPNEAQSRAALREMADYCRSRGLVLESGWLCGAPRRAIVPYAEKWGADLVVLGVKRSSRVLRRLLGDPAETILRSTELALYAAT
jgi:nucleotide-binding universal stress UspA family protein